ncbi:unnamed protein product [Hydatigera taeniaeformis]|uniref:Golgi resident protein GCP60 n=1 Tax=Hydatigena taeniaeformis TaxID=6205 RepID=A0A158RD77_HYDTA|nr:unnamed protein product [Hydatigera taeniaeformis]
MLLFLEEGNPKIGNEMRANDFDIACVFYKSNTYTYQAKHGPFSPEKVPDVGIFDFIGKERRAKWQSLGAMSRAEAQDTFVQSLLQICPLFAAHLEATDAMSYQKGTSLESQECNDLPPTAVHGLTRSQIRSALNAQTLHQFRAYAAQYYPDSNAKQEELIAQLQDRHFRQYMIYVSRNPPTPPGGIPSQNLEQPSPNNKPGSDQSPPHPWAEDQSNRLTVPKSTKDGTASSPVSKHRRNGSDLLAHIPDGGNHVAVPQMWTRNDINEFKALLGKDPESVINVGSGELITIRVSVVPSGNSLVWEFATDDYDIGFGLSFEWPADSKIPTSNSAGEDEQTVPTEKPFKAPWSLIQGSSQPPEKGENSSHATIEELIPVYRRTSHMEVYCGSHHYPASGGTYLLKFDNTYSLWRNKILYYRVYCTQ